MHQIVVTKTFFITQESPLQIMITGMKFWIIIATPLFEHPISFKLFNNLTSSAHHFAHVSCSFGLRSLPRLLYGLLFLQGV